MDEDRAALIAGLIKRLIWIAIAAVIAAALTVVALAATGPITFNLALAVVLGVFFTFVLGGGLFAVSFFSARGGYDQDAAEPNESDRPHKPQG